MEERPVREGLPGGEGRSDVILKTHIGVSQLKASPCLQVQRLQWWPALRGLPSTSHICHMTAPSLTPAPQTSCLLFGDFLVNIETWEVVEAHLVPTLAQLKLQGLQPELRSDG